MSGAVAASSSRVLALALASGLLANAAVIPSAAEAASAPAARVVLDGKALGLTQPDDLTRLGGDLFVAFQNGVPSTGGAAGTPSRSVVVEFTPAGVVRRQWKLTGKCDGLTADPTHRRVIATVNEDGHSSLYTLAVSGGMVSHYGYDASPLPHGGGTDSITVDHGQIYLAASAPATGGPALYQVTLGRGVAHLSAAPFYDTSTASVANLGAGNRRVNLALTDPDSATVVPAGSPRFAGDFELTAQGDLEQVYVSGIGTPRQRLSVLNLSQSVDDTAFVTSATGTLYATDAVSDTVVAIRGGLRRGVAYTAVTPSNANHAPSTAGKNYLGRINLNTGTVSPVATTGAALTPKGLIFVP